MCIVDESGLLTYFVACTFETLKYCVKEGMQMQQVCKVRCRGAKRNNVKNWNFTQKWLNFFLWNIRNTTSYIECKLAGVYNFFFVRQKLHTSTEKTTCHTIKVLQLFFWLYKKLLSRQIDVWDVEQKKERNWLCSLRSVEGCDCEREWQVNTIEDFAGKPFGKDVYIRIYMRCFYPTPTILALPKKSWNW